MEFNHQSVLLNETIANLNIKKNLNYVDATLGGGGHSLEILKKNSPKGLLIGVDKDKSAIKAAKKVLIEYKDRTIFVNDNFINVFNYDNTRAIPIHGIIFDLGVSSYQLSDETRGFSFAGEYPLDMRMGEGLLTAKIVVNTYSAKHLQDIFSKYGEEKRSKTISMAIVAYRKKKKIEYSNELAQIVKDVYGKSWKKRIHPATQVFQAIRIEVNDELKSIENALEIAISKVEKGGRIAVISFHSLEDRIVKNVFNKYVSKEKINKYKAQNSDYKLKIITKKPIIPTEKEIAQNPRSRSAKLRVVEVINKEL